MVHLLPPFLRIHADLERTGPCASRAHDYTFPSTVWPRRGCFRVTPWLSVHKGNLDAALHRHGKPLDLSPSLISICLSGSSGNRDNFSSPTGAEGKRVEPRAGLSFQFA